MAGAQPIAIIGATVVYGTGAAPARLDVLVRGERIEAVGVGLAMPPDARVNRAEGHPLLPGLFDLHSSCRTRRRGHTRRSVRTVRDFDYYANTFQAGSRWKSVKIRFAALRRANPKQPAAWAAQDLLLLQFELTQRGPYGGLA